MMHPIWEGVTPIKIERRSDVMQLFYPVLIQRAHYLIQVATLQTFHEF